MTIDRLKRNKLAFWQFLRRELQDTPCNHTFTHTHVFVSNYTHLEWTEVQQLLESNNAHCDCETANLLLKL